MDLADEDPVSGGRRSAEGGLREEQRRSIVAHLAELRAEHGDAFAAPALVEPTSEYFPDEFALEPEAIVRLVHRMATYAPIAADLELVVGFIEDEGGGGGGGCGTGGACGTGAGGGAGVQGTALETKDGYAVLVHVADVGEPKLLTTAIARGLGRVVLFEAGDDVDARDEGAVSELTAIASGFGLILLGGSSIYKKGCGGLRQHRGTHLSVEEIAFALALFVRATDVPPSRVKKHLEPTQREAFDAALAWVDGQPRLVRALASTPERLTDGVFELESKKGFFARLLARTSPRDPADDEPAEAVDEHAARARARSEARSEAERRRIAETKALVDEALRD